MLPAPEEEPTEPWGGHSSETPEEGAGQPAINARLQQIEGGRRRRPYPLYFAPTFTNVVVKYLIWSQYYRIYTWSVIDVGRVCEDYRVDVNFLTWRVRRAGAMVKYSKRRPLFLLVYFTTDYWTVVYSCDMYEEERRRQRKFIF